MNVTEYREASGRAEFDFDDGLRLTLFPYTGLHDTSIEGLDSALLHRGETLEAIMVQRSVLFAPVGFWSARMGQEELAAYLETAKAVTGTLFEQYMQGEIEEDVWANTYQELWAITCHTYPLSETLRAGQEPILTQQPTPQR